VNETDLEALTRDKEELSVDLEANSQIYWCFEAHAHGHSSMFL
jgi:hypothetical protein